MDENLMQPAPDTVLAENLRRIRVWMKCMGRMSTIWGALGILSRLFHICGAGLIDSGEVLQGIILLLLSGIMIGVGVVQYRAGSRVDPCLPQPAGPTLAELVKKLKLHLVLSAVFLIIGLVSLTLGTIVSITSTGDF